MNHATMLAVKTIFQMNWQTNIQPAIRKWNNEREKKPPRNGIEHFSTSILFEHLLEFGMRHK